MVDLLLALVQRFRAQLGSGSAVRGSVVVLLGCCFLPSMCLHFWQCFSILGSVSSIVSFWSGAGRLLFFVCCWLLSSGAGR
jgi:hypothetical protein